MTLVWQREEGTYLCSGPWGLLASLAITLLIKLTDPTFPTHSLRIQPDEGSKNWRNVCRFFWNQ